MAEQNKELVNLEKLEIEVLHNLNSRRLLDELYFGGGTMLRLCHGLNRYSTDLDFWIKPDAESAKIYAKLKEALSVNYTISDNQNKFYSLVFQIKSPISKRSLKIEIRKEQDNFEWERRIAFSNFTNKQVQLNSLTLDQMMKNKISALLSRKIIRDVFDIDFLVKRGVKINVEKFKLETMLKVIESFNERDLKVTLGSLLEKNERDYVVNEKFSFLKQTIISKINLHS